MRDAAPAPGGAVRVTGRVQRPERLAAVSATGLADRRDVPGLDRLARLASRLLGTPTTLVSLVTADRQVFPGRVGMEVGGTPLSHSFCQYVVADDEPLVVTDARADPRLSDNLAIPDLGVIAYAGIPIRVDGETLGAFCAIDSRPRAWTGTDLAVLEDLTAAVESEIALSLAARDAERSAAAFAAVLDVAHDAFVSIAPDGVVVEWNQAAEAMFGWSRAEATGRELTGLIIPPEYHAAHDAGLIRVRATGVSALAGRRVELTGQHRTGRRFPVELTLQVTAGHSGLRLHGFLRDISERRAAEDALTDRNRRLEQANLLKLDLMGMLSHDIGTPLATIIGYGEVLAESLSEPRQQTILDKILNGARRIDQLRQNVLAMCTIDADRLQARREPVPLAPALREALLAADLAVPVACPPGVTVLVNPAHLQQIVVNFLSNAAKYGGGPTLIAVTAGEDAVGVSIHDEGPGVPAAMRAHLFERYTRAAGVTAKGHGLGLHIVASLAEANGGSVSHRDNTPAGSVFTLTLQPARPEPGH